MSNYKFTVVTIALVVSILFTGTISFARQTTQATRVDDSLTNTSSDATAPSVIQMAIFASDTPFESCYDASQSTIGDGSLPPSSTYRQSDWDLLFVMYNNTSPGSWFDINGDGLTDYVYAFTNYNYNGGTTYTFIGVTCVALNTGSGFEIVHVCSAGVTKDYNTLVLTEAYFGDCAG